MTCRYLEGERCELGINLRCPYNGLDSICQLYKDSVTSEIGHIQTLPILQRGSEVDGFDVILTNEKEVA